MRVMVWGPSSASGSEDGALAALRAMAGEVRQMELDHAAERAVLLKKIQEKDGQIYQLLNGGVTLVGAAPPAKKAARKAAAAAPRKGADHATPAKPAKSKPKPKQAPAKPAAPPGLAAAAAASKSTSTSTTAKPAKPTPAAPAKTAAPAPAGADPAIRVSRFKAGRGGATAADGASDAVAGTAADAAAQAAEPPPPRLGHRTRPKQVPLLNLHEAMVHTPKKGERRLSRVAPVKMPATKGWKPPVKHSGAGAKTAAQIAAEQKKLLLRAGGKAAFAPKAPPAKPKPKLK